jgi:hypothetical protein
VSAYPGNPEGSVLDVGCRDQALRQAPEGLSVRYVGLDIVIALPNQFDIGNRWATVMGRNRSGKYGLPL